MKSLSEVLGRKLRVLQSLKPEIRLAMSKRTQKNTFLYLRRNFSQLYQEVEMFEVPSFVTTLWQKFNESAMKVFLPKPPFNFLRTKIIRTTMSIEAYGEWLAEERTHIEKTLPQSTLRELLEEDTVGKPIICDSKYLTSHNSIHHLYHLVSFQNKTGCKISNYDSIVEWGGGYGNIAKLVNRMNKQITYTIIDTPLFCCIQWLYLASILGEDKINIITHPQVPIIEQKINLLPLGLLTRRKVKVDLFIATWSLSESSKFAQDYVHSIDFFGAKHLLVAFQESSESLPDAYRIKDIVVARGAMIQAIDFLPGNYYAFI